jgi:NarL family two-component system response regulator LiaR
MAKKYFTQEPGSPAMAGTCNFAGSTIPRSDKPVTGMIRILIADDHAVMRQGLSVSLNREPDMAIVGEAADGMTALEKTRSLRPNVVLMDLGMPQMDGIEATRRIHSEMPKVHVIGLSTSEEGERDGAMLEAGAVGCLNKSCSVEDLIAAIRRSMGASEVQSG